MASGVCQVFGESLGIPAVLAAMIGLCILLLSGTLKWQECLNYAPAWDTLFWFAVLIGLSGQLNSMGIISAFSAKCGAFLTGLNLGTMPLFVILHVVFFAIHYLFASQTAHVAALYSAFLTLMLSAGELSQARIWMPWPSLGPFAHIENQGHSMMPASWYAVIHAVGALN